MTDLDEIAARHPGKSLVVFSGLSMVGGRSVPNSTGIVYVDLDGNEIDVPDRVYSFIPHGISRY